jgi:LmbE family N-acetylglucosaminyl deacetylase
VLSCAGLIAGADDTTVLTVFSDGPEHPGRISDWDHACGFSVGDDVMAARAAEDAAALARLGATPAALGFSQYRAAVPHWARFVIARGIRYVRVHRSGVGLAQRVANALTEQIQAIGVSTCAVPLGVAHPDHRITALACLEVARRVPDVRWLIYEDMPYSIQSPSGREAALAGLNPAGFSIEPVTLDLEHELEQKREALSCYRSQLEALGAGVEMALNTPERYYRLRPLGTEPAAVAGRSSGTAPHA